LYDPYGRNTAVIADGGGENLTTAYEYDNQSQVTKVTRPDTSSVATVRDGRGLVKYEIATANSRSATKGYFYDGNGNLLKTQDAEDVSQYYDYDGFSRRIRVRTGR